MKFLKAFCLLYLVCSSWTNAFAITSLLTVPVTILAVITLFSLFYISIIPNFPLAITFKAKESILSLMMVALGISVLMNPNEKSLNYLLVYFFTFYGSYMLLNSLFLKFISLKSMLNANLVGVLFVSGFCLIEFFLQILFGFKVQDLIPRSMQADAIYLINLPRVYGFSEEPTYLGWYFNTLGLIAGWWLYTRKTSMLIKVAGIISISLSYLLTFSAASIPLLLVVSAAVVFIYARNKIFFLARIAAILIVGSLILAQYIDFEVVEPLLNKITLSQDVTATADHRGEVWKESLSQVYASYGSGFGLGYFSANGQGSPMNYYLFLLIESGLIPCLLFIVFIGLVYQKLFLLELKYRKVLLIGFTCAILHLFTQSLFYHPCLWLTIIFINKFHQLQIEVRQDYAV